MASVCLIKCLYHFSLIGFGFLKPKHILEIHDLIIFFSCLGLGLLLLVCAEILMLPDWHSIIYIKNA